MSVTCLSASRRSSSDLRFSQCGMGSTFCFATAGRVARLPYSTARCCSSASM